MLPCKSSLHFQVFGELQRGAGDQFKRKSLVSPHGLWRSSPKTTLIEGKHWTRSIVQPAIINHYSKIVEFASNKFSDFAEGLDLQRQPLACGKLRSKAASEKLNDEVETEPMTKWMESQGTNWNLWGHLY